MAHLPRIIVDAPLYCPHCGARHVDESRNGEKWHRRAHTTHRCQACRRDFDVYVSGEAPPDPSTSDLKVVQVIYVVQQTDRYLLGAFTDLADLHALADKLGWYDIESRGGRPAEVVEVPDGPVHRQVFKSYPLVRP